MKGGGGETNAKRHTNNFPYQTFVDRISQYTDAVYVTTLGLPKYENGEYINNDFTSMNGNIVVTSNTKEVVVECSNNNLKLKETEWFLNNRKMPDYWK